MLRARVSLEADFLRVSSCTILCRTHTDQRSSCCILRQCNVFIVVDVLRYASRSLDSSRAVFVTVHEEEIQNYQHDKNCRLVRVHSFLFISYKTQSTDL